MRYKLSLLVLVAAILAAPIAAAQGEPPDMQALRTGLRTDKKALVMNTLTLNDAEAKKFWPIYDAYQRSVDAANRRRVVAAEQLIGTDRPISDLFARALANELIAIDEAEIRSRRQLHNRVIKALPTKKAARYLQLEAKARAVQAYDLASAVPLVR
jgi:Spy/CpxP family protein refolding chaperone